MDQIVSRSMIFDRGVDAFNAGRTRDSHNMNWHSPALVDWRARYDHAARLWANANVKQAEVVMAEA